MGSEAQGQGHARRVNPVSGTDKRKGRPFPKEWPPLFSVSGAPETSAYATVFTFSAATATRFEIGCAASLASLISASVFFEASATYESNAPRK